MQISDASHFSGHADQIFTPRHEEEIAEILTRAAREGMPITIMGALTGLAGGAVPQGGWAISMANFKCLDITDGAARAGAGTLLRDVQNAALAAGQFYAPDPTENTSSLGGNIAANASGSRSFRYGSPGRCGWPAAARAGCRIARTLGRGHCGWPPRRLPVKTVTHEGRP